MIALTSISPKHAIGDAQLVAVRSWVENGLKVYSFNSQAEIDILKETYKEVEFVATNRTHEHQWGRPYVSLNALLDFAKEQEDEDVVLINSDIVLTPCRGILEYQFSTHCSDSIGIINRYDFEADDYSDARIYPFGFDVFLIKKKNLKVFPQSIYALGQTWWDYFVPYTAVKSGVMIHRINGMLAMHRKHQTQWSDESWRKMTKFFALENDLTWSKTAEQTTGKILQSINNSLNINVRT